VEESVRGKPRPHTTMGDRAFARHITIWESYLAPALADINRKR